MSSILGISAFYHDSAACLLINGEIIAAAQEERFTRIKNDSSFPLNSIKFILNFSKKKLSDIDHIVFYEKPFLKFERILETYLAFAPKGFKSFCTAMPIWLKEKLFQKNLLIQNLEKIEKNSNIRKKIYFSEHHLSHAASAFFPSPFKEAVIITADGVGEWATTTIAVAKNNNLEIKEEIQFPHSIGLLYSAFTYYVGFKVNSGEYKLMGLAPYGKPKYEDIILDNLISVKEDGSFVLDQSYFNYATGLTMTNEKFNKLFSSRPRRPKEKITQFHMDIAASIQKVTEKIMLRISRYARKKFNINKLCLAGGVALNCVVNGKIYYEKIFDKIWIQPAAGDAGGALGAALSFWHIELKKERITSLKDDMKGSYLGPQFSDEEIEKTLKEQGIKFSKLEENEIIKKTAKELSDGKAIGWFQGRMEFGPRALGSRSILADPRNGNMQKKLNLKIKFRESFRPFAPSILEEDVSEWFDFDETSPYMLNVVNINPKIKKIQINENTLSGFEKLKVERSNIPSVTHVDYSARIQTVNGDYNHKYYQLIKNFKKLTNCPILINTSFNIRGEPIVCSIVNAIDCFMGTNLDFLVIENFFIDKRSQTKSLVGSYKSKFELD